MLCNDQYNRKGWSRTTWFCSFVVQGTKFNPKGKSLLSIKDSLKTITKGLSSNSDFPSLLSSVAYECIYMHLSVETTVDVGCSSVLISVFETGPLSEPVVCNFA